MNKKKFAAIMMVAALTTSSMSAFAASATPVPTTPPAPVSTPGVDETITGSGSSTVVDTSTKYSVVLPTSSALDFKVDPQGLLNLENGSSSKPEDLAGAGAIVSTSGAFIKNQSSAPVVVTAKLSIKSAAASPVDFTLVNTVAAVSPTAPPAESSDQDKSKDKNMLLVVVPGTEKVASIDDYTASKTVVPITAKTADDGLTTTDVKFLLDKADYVITKDSAGTASYELAPHGDDNFDAVSFKLGGEVNTNANWKDFNADGFTITAVFSFADAATADVANQTGAYGLIAPDSSVIKNYEGITAGLQVSLSADGTLTVTNLTGDANIANGASDIKLGVDGNMYVVADSAVTWDTDGWDAANGGTLIIKLSKQYNVYNGKTTTVSIALSDGSTITCSGTLNLPE